MQVAEILSDITSLRVCGQNEALALVNVHRVTSGTKASDTPAENSPTDTGETQPIKKEDLRRAKELVELHYEFKSRHANGEVGDALRRAREDVWRVMGQLA